MFQKSNECKVSEEAMLLIAGCQAVVLFEGASWFLLTSSYAWQQYASDCSFHFYTTSLCVVVAQILFIEASLV
jgi:hypothetical protein